MVQYDQQHLRSARMQVWSLAQHSGSKDSVLPKLQCRLQLWLRSEHWPGNSHMLQGSQKQKKRKKKWQGMHISYGNQRQHETIRVIILGVHLPRLITINLTISYYLGQLRTLYSWCSLLGFQHNKNKQKNRIRLLKSTVVKGLTLSLLWLRVLICYGLDPWPENFWVLRAQPKNIYLQYYYIIIGYNYGQHIYYHILLHIIRLLILHHYWL